MDPADQEAAVKQVGPVGGYEDFENTGIDELCMNIYNILNQCLMMQVGPNLHAMTIKNWLRGISQLKA